MIKVYSQESCMPCKSLKRFLELQGIKYEEKMIDTDEANKQELVDMGYSSTPVLVFPDGEALVGFTPLVAATLMKKSGMTS